ncbi:MAG: ion transporter [Mariniblastus sp.]|nr:ion transporter [Mariniblastus sp.]
MQRFFFNPWVEILVGVLVLLSVTLTLLELWLESKLNGAQTTIQSAFGQLSDLDLNRLMWCNGAITLIFTIELTTRFIAANSKTGFFREFWIDILATIPLFGLYPGFRALRLLRLFRLVRLMGVMTRLSAHFPYVIRHGFIEFVRICGLLFVAVLFGTIAIMYVEQHPAVVATPQTQMAPADTVSSSAEPEFDMDDSFWFSLYTLFAGEPIPSTPKTLLGKVVTVFLMFMGLTIFAIFAGTVSAFMVDRLRVEGRVVQWDELRDHIIICGWTPKTDIIIREYRHSKATKSIPIVIITEVEAEKYQTQSRKIPNIFFVKDDFTKVTALKKAGIERARTCLVLADTTGGRSEQDADARTILAALTVEKINQDVYTCAELLNRSYATHLELGKVNEYVISGEHGAYMIAQAGMHRGLIDVLGELLSYERGNEFFRSAIPESWVGLQFDKKLSELKQNQNAILVAVHTAQGEGHVNPENYEFQPGDEVVAISKGNLKLT